MERRTMLLASVDGQWLTIDRCSFCAHLDRTHKYEKCTFADFQFSVDECSSFCEIPQETVQLRIQELF